MRQGTPCERGRFRARDAPLRQDRIRRRDIRAVEEWGQKHRAALYSNWDLARTGAPPQKIENDAARNQRGRSPS
jgi:hypothetical protein